MSTVNAQGYRTIPDHEDTGWPQGIPYIIGNEACERFSYYGMRTILFVHLAALYMQTGVLEKAAKDLATSTTHLFFAGVYALPMIGALLADRLLGKYNTIFWLSLVYCAGHAALAIGDGTLTGMYVGLTLIAIGAGGIKPCVSANVGDQFGRGNWPKVRTVYQVFYFSINFGSLIANLSIPLLKEHFGAGVAFGVPGVLMFLATFVFWLGRKRYVHVPPKPGGKLGLLDASVGGSLFMAVGHLFFSAHGPWPVQVGLTLAFLALAFVLFRVRQSIEPEAGFLAVLASVVARAPVQHAATGGTNGSVAALAPETAGKLATSRFWRPAVDRYGVEAVEGTLAVLRIVSVFALVSPFWALFEQHSTTWIRQATQMDLVLWEGQKFSASQTAFMNPLLVLLFLPLVNVMVRGVEKLGIRATPLRRMTAGMFIAALSFIAISLIQREIDVQGDGKVWVVWQVLPYVLVTIAEVLVSVTGLEFAYTQAPAKMKAVILGFWLLSNALAQVFVALLARFGDLSLQNFFWVFSALMLAAAAAFGVRAYFYVYRDPQQQA